ncbi:MAG: molybdopterin-dependent oxidoreductase [Chloroflexi bacterium]|nr:molybdopterin-dependent oxidoreductase [Chloroflexota bacterium]
MKKGFQYILMLVLLAAVITGCTTSTPTAEPTAEPTAGPALVTVSGKIANGTYVLDQAAFDAHSKEVDCFDPWVGDSGKDVTEKGILLKDLIDLAQADSDATTISLVATDGKAFDIPIADAQQYDIVLAHWVDGEMLAEDGGGPVKLAYPKDATSYTADNWAWWIVGAEIK